MKIKRWKEILTGIALVGAITPAISISANKNNTSQVTKSLSVLNNTTSKTIIDYSMVEKMMSEVSLKSFNSQNNVELTPEQEQKVQELQQHYLDLFKSNNYSLEEIQTYMCENFPFFESKFKENYEQLFEFKSINLTTFSKSFTSKHINKEKLRNAVKSLVTEKWVLVGTQTTLLAVTAGFWATFMWYWAGICTAASSALAAVLGCLCSLIDRINEYIDNKISEDYVKGQIDGLKKLSNI